MTDERWGDDEIDALLAAARDVPPAPAAARARVAERLATTLTPPASPPMSEGLGRVTNGAAADGAAAGGATTGGVTTGGAMLSTTGWAVVVGLTLAVGIGIGWLRPGSEPWGPSSVAPPSESGTSEAGSRESRSSGADSPTERPEDSVSPAPAEPQSDRSGVDRALAAERALLQAARQALVAGRVDPALDALATHEARFAAGRLVEEREVLWIRALLAAERVDDARARARAFVTAHPDSLFRPAIEALSAR